MTLLYLDARALFKRYVEETEAEALLGRIEDAPAVGTALITRVEVAAALAKAVRDDRMPSSEAREAESDFLKVVWMNEPVVRDGTRSGSRWR